MWEKKRIPICSVGQFQWCKCSHDGQFPAIDMISLNPVLEREMHDQLLGVSTSWPQDSMVLYLHTPVHTDTCTLYLWFKKEDINAVHRWALSITCVFFPSVNLLWWICTCILFKWSAASSPGNVVTLLSLSSKHRREKGRRERWRKPGEARLRFPSH